MPDSYEPPTHSTFTVDNPDAANDRGGSRKQAATSFFEFWPTWLIYLPVVFQWLLLSIKYRSLTLPLLANPLIPLAGMVGGSKDALMTQATGACRKAILPWVCHEVTPASASTQADEVIELSAEQDITFPFVCKPDVGCRGAGVKLIEQRAELEALFSDYPVGARMICQKLASYEPEVGVFFVREPNEPSGSIVSLTFKQTPEVIGNGKNTLAELVSQDPRAAGLIELYYERNKAIWLDVIPADARHRLIFSASHCRGAVFVDARLHITAELEQRLNTIMSDLPDFYYGRLDVKFRDLESLRLGKHLEIVEINGASSESIHIWDKDARLSDAIKTLLWQYRTLFRLGAWQRKQGLTPPGLLQLLKAWRYERGLTQHYPETD